MGTILSESALLRVLAGARRRGRRIVTVNGSFDILHAGHARMLVEAKAQGDALVVLVNSDVSVRAYKGPGRPIVPERERAELVAALALVDYITIFNDLTPVRILGRIKPHVHANGADWGKNCVERATVERHGGRIHVLRFHRGASTTGVVDRIAGAREVQDVRAVFLDRDGTINHNGAGFTHRAADFRFLPGVIPALRRLAKSNYKIIIITNQSGIGRGYYTARDMERLHRWMARRLKERGVRIDAIYHCPHLPNDGCTCRKPEPGLFLRAANEFGLNLSKSWFVGDEPHDVVAGRRANLQTIKLGSRMPRKEKLEPHAYAERLSDAVAIILSARAR